MLLSRPIKFLRLLKVMEAPGYKLLSSSSGKGVVTFNGGVPTGSGFILK